MFQDYLEAADKDSTSIKNRIINCIMDAGNECSKNNLINELGVSSEELDSSLKELIKSKDIIEIPRQNGQDVWFALDQYKGENVKGKFIANYIKSLDADAMGELLLKLADDWDVSGFDESKTKRFIYNRLSSMESLKQIKEFLDIDEE